MPKPTDEVDLLVIGGGLAGLTAARQARKRGLSALVVSWTPGSLPHTSGAMDLLAVYPTALKRSRDRPWAALLELIEREPDHPYTRVGLQEIRDAWSDFVGFLAQSRLGYHAQEDRNQLLITAAGTLKPAFAVPASMRANVEAWERKEPTLILGISGLAGFSAAQVVGGLRDRWIGLRADTLDVVSEADGAELASLFGHDQRVTAARLASKFELPGFRERFADAVRPRLDGARALGLPAVLGYDQVVGVCADLSERLGVPVFEIPMITPTLAGIRLADLLLEATREAGVEILRGQPVTGLRRAASGNLAATLVGVERSREIHAERVLLATGRFFGGGLEASPDGVQETVVGLPIEVPPSRDDWHMNTFLGAPGHPINRAGLEVDEAMRVLGPGGRPALPGLHAAGAILAHHDWVREKSGAGISVATAWKAVASMTSMAS
jgi:glycerol-3-phosphate dehydrogenase subunit B